MSLTGKSRRKIIVFESDDWGGLGWPDLRTYRKAMRNPDIRSAVNRSAAWRISATAMDSLESVADLDALVGLLLRFRGGDGRPAVFTPVYFLANPDYDAIRARGFTAYYDRGIDAEYPPPWRARGDVLAKARAGICLGVWAPESHNTRAAGHFDPHKWVRLLREGKDRGFSAFFDLRMIGKPAEVTTDKGLEFDSMGLDELNRWVKTGTNYFRNAFGYAPRVSGLADARGRCKALAEIMEKILARHGVKTILNAANRAMGAYNRELDLVYIKRNAVFEPLGIKARATKGGWKSCYAEILKAWSENQPAIVNTHRVNYTSLDPAKKAESLRQLECLLALVQKEHPEAVYHSSYELGRNYRRLALAGSPKN